MSDLLTDTYNKESITQNSTKKENNNQYIPRFSPNADPEWKKAYQRIPNYSAPAPSNMLPNSSTVTEHHNQTDFLHHSHIHPEDAISSRVSTSVNSQAIAEHLQTQPTVELPKTSPSH